MADLDPSGDGDGAEFEEANEGLDDDDVAADYDAYMWQVADRKYGLHGLLRCREAMLPIAKPEETRHLKWLVYSGPLGSSSPEKEERSERSERSERPDRGGKAKGKGKGYANGAMVGGGRIVEQMGRTEQLAAPCRGTWWRNVCPNEMDVIIRANFSLQSEEVRALPHGKCLQQAGPAEVFVSGPAEGLVRMPVMPRGWVTVDATSVGGPRYVDRLQGAPRWKVTFKSGSALGDIVVREDVSLESQEVTVLWYEDVVEQNGVAETLDDGGSVGIVRLPITFTDKRHNNERGYGWVTMDASAQGGPVFFEEFVDPARGGPPSGRWNSETLPDGTAWEADTTYLATRSDYPSMREELRSGHREHYRENTRERRERRAQGNKQERERPPRETGDGEEGAAAWTKNRTWRVCNLESAKLPVISRPEPFAPKTDRTPPEDLVMRWLVDGDEVEQTGHSKKMRGYMVMPVKTKSEPQVEGWVCRRLADKARDRAVQWMVEVGKDGATKD